MSGLNAGIASFGLCKSTAQIWSDMKVKGNRSATMRQLLNIWAIQEGSSLAISEHTSPTQSWTCEGLDDERCNPMMTNRCPVCWPHSEYVKLKKGQRSERSNGSILPRFRYDNS